MSLPVDFAPAGNGDMKLSARAEGRRKASGEDGGAFARIVRQMNRLIDEADAKAAGKAGAMQGDGAAELESAVEGETVSGARETHHPMGREATSRHSFAHRMFAHGDWHRPADEAAGTETEEKVDTTTAANDETVAATSTDDTEAADGNGDLAGAAGVTVPQAMHPDAPPATVAPLKAEGDEGAALAFAPTASDDAAAQEASPDKSHALHVRAPQDPAPATKATAGAAALESAMDPVDADTGTAPVPPVPADAGPTEPLAGASIRVTAHETHLPPTRTAADAPATDSAPETDAADAVDAFLATARDTPDSGSDGQADAQDESERQAAPREAARTPAGERSGAAPAPAVSGASATTTVSATPPTTAPATAGLPGLAAALSASLKGEASMVPGVAAPTPPIVSVAPGPVRSVSVTLETDEHGTLDVHMRLRDNGLDVQLKAERSETVERLRHDQAALAHLLRDHGYDGAVVRVEARHAAASADAGGRPDMQSALGNAGGGAADLAGGGRQAPADDRQPRLPDGVIPFDLDEPTTASHDPASAAPRGASGLYL